MREELTRRKVLSSAVGGVIGTFVATSFPLSTVFAQEVTPQDPRSFIMPEPTRTPLLMSSTRQQRLAPALERDLAPRRIDIGLDLSDLSSPQIVGEFNPSDLTRNYDPASWTKCLTSMVVTDFLRLGRTSTGTPLNMDTFVPILSGEKSLNLRGTDSRYGNLSGVLGTMNAAKVSTLMDMVLVGSRNGATLSLGRFIAGSYGNFVDLINQKAREIEMTNSFFINPSGLPANQDGMSQSFRFNNVVCIEDMARMLVIMHRDYPELEMTTRKQGYNIPGLRSHYNDLLVNMAPPTNPLFRDYDTGNEYARLNGVIGTKTGFTQNSGYCLISTAEPDNQTKICSITTGNATGRRGVVAKHILDATYEAVRVHRRNEMVRDCRTAEEAHQRLGPLEPQNSEIFGDQTSDMGRCLDRAYSVS